MGKRGEIKEFPSRNVRLQSFLGTFKVKANVFLLLSGKVSTTPRWRVAKINLSPDFNLATLKPIHFFGLYCKSRLACGLHIIALRRKARVLEIKDILLWDFLVESRIYGLNNYGRSYRS